MLLQEYLKTMDLDLLETGIPLIDRQHAAYEELTGRALLLCAESRVPLETLAQEVDQVRTYALDHFDCEEQLMRNAGYPQLKAHAAQHAIFRDQCETLAAELTTPPLASDFPTRLSRLLVDWFCRHVQTEDMKLAAFIREHAPSHVS